MPINVGRKANKMTREQDTKVCANCCIRKLTSAFPTPESQWCNSCTVNGGRPSDLSPERDFAIHGGIGDNPYLHHGSSGRKISPSLAGASEVD